MRRLGWVRLVVLVSLAGALGANGWKTNVDTAGELRRLFADPPAAYSTSPFFVWNGEITQELIERYLESYRGQGIHSTFIHPRPGLITPYLSERWFELVRHTVDEGRRRGQEIWLYDENSYPSGFAGGHVPAEMPESWNQGQGLLMRKLAALTGAERGRFKLILEKVPGGFRDVTAAPPQRAGEFYGFELVYYPKRAWHGGFSYVDLLVPGVTQKFIEITMKGYERAIGAEFGRTVPGIFTDEPNIIAPDRKASVRWTPDLFAEFRRRTGYDLAVNLAALWEEEGDWRRVRHDYYSLLLDLFIERWALPWQRYADSKGLLWTGHYWEHEWPSPFQVPDNMAMYAWHHVPGIDMLFNQFRKDVNAQFGNARSVRELASIANQMGRRRTLSETYGGAGWELRFEDMKRLGDWQAALGVNFMNQHLSFGTLVGARKHDYPQSFAEHTPWWKNYHVLANYFKRLSLGLAAGEQVNRVVVIEPTTTAWMYAAPGGGDPRLKALGASFQEFLNRLEAAQVEYDLASERIVREFGSTGGGRFTIGRRGYEVVVIAPGCENLQGRTVELLSAYLASGGRVLAVVEPPAYVDGVKSGKLVTLAERYRERWRRMKAEEAAASPLLASPGFTITPDGGSGEDLYHQRRRLGADQVLFLANASLERAASGRVVMEGRGVSRLDALSGAIVGYPARVEGGRLSLRYELPPAGSLLLLVSAEGAVEKVPDEVRAAGEMIAATGALEVRRLGPNALALDYCDLTLGEKTERGLYYYGAAEKAFQHHGIETNPWNTAVQYKTSILDRGRFPAGSGFRVTYWFEVGAGVDPKSLRAVIERPRLWRARLNGKPIEARAGEWYLDRDFGVYGLGEAVKEGRNALELEAQPMSIHHEIEPVYILGEFALEAQAAGWRLTGARPLKLGGWGEQGMPLYSERVAYGRTYRLGEVPRRAVVRLGRWHGTVAEVVVNGTSAGVIGWQPYELEVTRWLRRGENRIEVEVVGSLKNLLGPHHGKINRGLTSPWSFRSAPEQPPPGSAYDLERYGLFEEFTLTGAGGRASR